MVLKTLLIISIILQLIAAIIAIRLTRTTKYNVAWMLFSFALLMMCMFRLHEFMQVTVGREWRLPPYFMAWAGVITSLCLAVGLFYINKIITSVRRLNYQRKLTERRILNTVLRTEEKERLHFSKELHDGLGPLLSSAKMSLTALSRDEHNAEQREIIDNTTYVIEEAIRSLREISNNLSPHVLNDFGLARGVQNFIDKSVAMHDVKIRFTTNLRSERYDTDVEVILYRVICELINNSLKHSGCTSINLSLSQNGSELTLDYSDNGRGFNPQAMMDCGMGLSNISSRINSLGGSCSITSSKGKGMQAAIRVNTQEDPAVPARRDGRRKKRS